MFDKAPIEIICFAAIPSSKSGITEIAENYIMRRATVRITQNTVKTSMKKCPKRI